MRRLFWIALGATVGILVVRKLSRAADQFTPEGLAASAGRLADAALEIAETIKDGMAQREAELKTALGIDSGVIDPETVTTFHDDTTR